MSENEAMWRATSTKYSICFVLFLIILIDKLRREKKKRKKACEEERERERFWSLRCMGIGMKWGSPSLTNPPEGALEVSHKKEEAGERV